jgi:hypothetical protein
MKTIAGYAGHIPGKRFLKGGATHGVETEVLDYQGMQFQSMQPTQMPQTADKAPRFVKDAICPGYQGHVAGQRFVCGNYRVVGYENQYKGEVQKDTFFYNNNYSNPWRSGRPGRPLTSHT